MTLRSRWAAVFTANREVCCWLADLGLSLGGGGTVSVEARAPASCPLRVLLPPTLRSVGRFGRRR